MTSSRTFSWLNGTSGRRMRCGGSWGWSRRFASAVPAAIQPALRPMTSMIETRSPWPMASLSQAISRTVVARYLIDAAVARAVVGDGQVVVDRLRHADDAQLIALLLGQLRDLVGRVLGVVAADVEEIADVVGLEDLQDPLEILLLLQLVAARAERGPRGVAQGADLLLGLGGQVDDLLLQDAQHAVQAAVDLLDALMVERLVTRCQPGLR